jgi:hypothetical protein
MQPVIGIPTQIDPQHKADLQARYWGDASRTGIVKSLENAKLGSAILAGVAAIGAAGALVSGALPAAAALMGVAYASFAGSIVSDLAKSHQASKSLERETAATSRYLSPDEKEAAEWMRNGYFGKSNITKALLKFEASFSETHGRDPQINWVKIGVEIGSRKLIDFAADRASKAELLHAADFIFAKGNVPSAISDRVEREQAKIDSLNPDRARLSSDATWFSRLKETFAGMFATRENESVKSAFADATSAWRSDASGLLDRVAERHGGLREGEVQRDR